MPRYSRRYRRRPRRYVRRWFKRRFRRYVNGSSRSTIRLKVPVHYTDTYTQAANAQGTAVGTMSPFLPSTSYSSALTSALYRQYCLLYDEVKCIGMKFTVNVASTVGGADIPSLQIYTAFDRRKGNAEYAPSYAELATFSTAQIATAVNNSVAKLTRSLYASDLLEKAQWHDCSLINTAGTFTDAAYTAAGPNPNFFAPCSYLCFCVPGVTASKQVTVSVDIMYYFAFRNPKYGQAAQNAKVEIEMLPRTLDEHPQGDDDDMAPAPIPLDDEGDDDMARREALRAADRAEHSASVRSSQVASKGRSYPIIGAENRPARRARRGALSDTSSTASNAVVAVPEDDSLN